MKLLPLLFLSLFTIIGGCSSMPKKSTGIRLGQFQPCPSSPNCVSSQSSPTDTVHFISPLKYSGDIIKAHKIIEKILKEYPRTSIISNTPEYIHAIFKTKIMRFRDDVEFYFSQEEKIIHIQSMSRIGYSDMGTNRKRMEEIRLLFSRDS